MSSLLKKAFLNAKKENRPALLTYTVAGDNTKKKSLEILNSISNFADICELGFPHNTPIADGGQIQTSAYRAIKNGIKINDLFQISKKIKKICSKPIILHCNDGALKSLSSKFQGIFSLDEISIYCFKKVVNDINVFLKDINFLENLELISSNYVRENQFNHLIKFSNSLNV